MVAGERGHVEERTGSLVSALMNKDARSMEIIEIFRNPSVGSEEMTIGGMNCLIRFSGLRVLLDSLSETFPIEDLGNPTVLEACIQAP
ncbi:hypothetical protein WN48_06526 [Eufriesea mexicana]|uniref:Uncharacterized protein n=1 Tax=Eufriesea mexicana TaxID=516756 RepID=A0A310SK02_9HYME|nr:hypothetical protein WN48_06526 [Eufriesea mexicana]